MNVCLTNLGRGEVAKWSGKPPAPLKTPVLWKDLASELMEKKMYFGALSVAGRALSFFSDLEVKEAAYKTIVMLADQGYPFSIQPYFVSGDLTPTSGDYGFENSYHLYKYILNHDRGLERWAKYYFENVDKEYFHKWQFYQAIQAYSKKDYKTAEELLKKILSKILMEDAAKTSAEKRASSFGDAEKLEYLKKITRTLARIYFDTEEYDKAYDIYQSFLLRLNPIQPNDWLEASWSLYHLKRYAEAVGMLFNLEKYAHGSAINLEKYTIRALSYRSLCAVENSDRLLESFNHDFGPTIDAIKRGESLSGLQQLVYLDVKENTDFYQAEIMADRLRDEMQGLSVLDSKYKELATYIYKTELQVLNQKLKAAKEQALETAARKLVMMGEHLRFLKFDIQRERFNPDAIFKKSLEMDSKSKLTKVGEQAYQLHWAQFGDYWRDERQKYRGVIEDQCGQ